MNIDYNVLVLAIDRNWAKTFFQELVKSTKEVCSYSYDDPHAMNVRAGNTNFYIRYQNNFYSANQFIGAMMGYRVNKVLIQPDIAINFPFEKIARICSRDLNIRAVESFSDWRRNGGVFMTPDNWGDIRTASTFDNTEIIKALLDFSA